MIEHSTGLNPHKFKAGRPALFAFQHFLFYDYFGWRRVQGVQEVVYRVSMTVSVEGNWFSQVGNTSN